MPRLLIPIRGIRRSAPRRLAASNRTKSIFIDSATLRTNRHPMHARIIRTSFGGPPLFRRPDHYGGGIRVLSMVFEKSFGRVALTLQNSVKDALQVCN